MSGGYSPGQTPAVLPLPSDPGPADPPMSELKPYTAERYTEIGEYLIFVRRVIRGLAKRVGEADLEALREMGELRDELDTAMFEAVAGLRSDPDLPASWRDIGDALGITRQGAQQRYGRAGGIRQIGGQPGNWR